MNWFRENRFLGTFLIVFGIALIAALVFLFVTRGSYNDARAQFDQNATELNRLQRLTPFPSETNLRKMKTQADDYAGDLNKLKEDLKTRVLPAVPMAPNEFQSRLRQAMTAMADRARTNKVKLPDNFFLGFDEFASALPDTNAAPELGQQLAQVETLLNMMIDARIDTLTAFRRLPPNEQLLPAAIPNPALSANARRGPAASPAPQSIERTVVEATFVAQPGAARRVINQIATANQQFYVIRTLHILNEKDKGPAREGTPAAAAAATPAPAGNNAAINFIVGNEKVQIVARIEMLRFTF